MNKRFNINLVLENDTLFADTNQVTQTPEEIEHDLDGLESSMERQLEIHNALEDLAEIASTIDTPTPREVALFQTAANMAVAGTDNEATDILPAMEAFKPLALEGFTDKIKESIKKIIQYFKDMWKKFSDWIKSFFNKQNKENKQELESLEKLIDKIKNIKDSKKDIEINTNVFFANGTKNLQELVTEMVKNTNSFTAEFSVNLTNFTANFQELAVKYSKDPTQENYQALLDNSTDEVEAITNLKLLMNKALTGKKEIINLMVPDSASLVNFLNKVTDVVKKSLQQMSGLESGFKNDIKRLEDYIKFVEGEHDVVHATRDFDNNKIQIAKLEVKHISLKIEATNINSRAYSALMSESIKLANDYINNK